MARSWLGGTPGCSGLGGWITWPGAVAAVSRSKLRATKGAARFARRGAAIMILLQAANEALLRLSHEGSGSQETARLRRLWCFTYLHPSTPARPGEYANSGLPCRLVGFLPRLQSC